MAAYELDDGHLEILSRLCEAMDRCDQARDALDEQGVTFRDKFDQLKPNPAAVIEVQNRSQVLKLLQALRLGEAELVSSTQPAQALARKRWSKA